MNFPVEYRIVRKMYCYTEVQYRFWWWPFWSVWKDKLTLEEANDLLRKLAEVLA